VYLKSWNIKPVFSLNCVEDERNAVDWLMTDGRTLRYDCFGIELFEVSLPVLDVEADCAIDGSDVIALLTTGTTVSYDGKAGGVADNCSISNSSLLFTWKHLDDGSSSALINHSKIKSFKTKIDFYL
jgi:hypothetical protein